MVSGAVAVVVVAAVGAAGVEDDRAAVCPAAALDRAAVCPAAAVYPVAALGPAVARPIARRRLLRPVEEADPAAETRD